MGVSEQAYERLERATAGLQAPFALIDLDAMNANARDLVRRGGGKPIRLASKSLRCRGLQERVLAREGFRGTLAYTLPEALWLAGQGARDIVVAYPTADEEALRELAEHSAGGTFSSSGGDAASAGGTIAVMVDSSEQLPLIERAASGVDGARVRVCLDIDAGWRALGGRVRVGVKRSPAHTPQQAAELAAAVVASEYAQLVGVMMYEAQIAGVGDTPPGRPLRARAIRAMQALSTRELAGRRARVVEAVEADGGLGPVCAGPVRRLSRLLAEPGGAVRAARRTPPGAGRGDGARRRVPGLGRGRRRAPAAPLPAGRAAPGPRGGRRGGADAAAR